MSEKEEQRISTSPNSHLSFNANLGSSGKDFKPTKNNNEGVAFPNLPMHMRMVTPLPSVSTTVEELWRCNVDDSARASHLMKLLRHAIISQMSPETHFLSSQENGIPSRRKKQFINRDLPFQIHVNFDPGETFLCIQRTSLRFHRRWMQRIEEWNMNKTQRKRKGEDPLEDEEENKHFEKEEKLSWNLWEEALSTSAALAKECVGPAWRWQLYTRRNPNVMRKYRRGIRRKSMETDDSVSSIGMKSTTSSQQNASIDFVSSEEEDCELASSSSIQSPSAEVAADSALSFFAGPLSQNLPPSNSSGQANHLSGLPIINYPPIPEVLPGAMIRFAASINNNILQRIHTLESNIRFFRYDVSENHITDADDEDPLTNNVPFDNIMYMPSQEDITSIVAIEKNQLQRRKRVGETQRDLVLSLCCGAKNDENSFQWNWSEEWSIAGARIPVASMFVFWAETAMTGWPKPKRDHELKSLSINASEIYYETKDSDLSNTIVPTDKNRMTNVVVQETLSENDEQQNGEKELDTTVINSSHNKTSPDKNELNSVYGDERVNFHLPSEIQRTMQWRELICPGPLDWNHTLVVSRAIADLIVAGWRPPQFQNQFGDESVMLMLDIAERGLNLQTFPTFMRPSEFKYKNKDTSQDARQERLAAISSASEVMSALASLGSKGFIPFEALHFSVERLCCLLAGADSDVSQMQTLDDLYPFEGLYDDGVEDWEQENKLLERSAFLSQREACLADTAELLWSLIAYQSSASATVAILFHLMDLRITSISTNTLSNEEISSYLVCSGAVRAIGAALWGNPPEVKGVESLRMFWCTTIEVYGKIALSISNKVDKNANPSLATNLLLLIILEVVLALRRIVDGELVEGNGELTTVEWDALIFALKKGLFLWLDDFGYKNNDDIPKTVEYKSCKTNAPDSEPNSHVNKHLSLRLTIKNEIYEICGELKYFLSKCASLTDSNEVRHHHMIVDDSCRRHLHLLLLVDACPTLPPLLGSSLAISVVNSWSSSGCFPYRGGNWCETASELMSYAFAVYDDSNCGYHGSYVHSPEVSFAVKIFECLLFLYLTPLSKKKHLWLIQWKSDFIFCNTGSTRSSSFNHSK